MENFRPSPITKVARTLLDLCARLNSRKAARKMAQETLQTAVVTHQEDMHKAQSRRAHFWRNPGTLRRSLAPSTGTSILRALNQTVELTEKQAMVQPDSNHTTLPPQAYQNRYTLALMVEFFRNTLSAVVGMTMMLHDYRQRDARKVYELVTQDKSSVKPDAKFFEKRTDIKTILKDRFDCFQLEPSGKEIHTTVISEAEADKTYNFLELCATLLGPPIFTTRFDPDKPIPELTSNTHNFDEENEVEHRRIRALVSPRSFENLMESLGDTNMKKRAKRPVLNSVFVSGNGNNGSHDLPEATEAEIQEDIDAIVNEAFDSAKFRRQLKCPDLEVVVDGATMSAPFTAISAVNRRFELPSVARFVQVFATQNNRREIVSNLVLPDTEISTGKTWRSQLRLEGRQIVKLTVEPTMDDFGHLASSHLVVAYQPALPIFARLSNRLKELGTRGLELWPSWITKPIFASILGCLALTPFFTIEIFSFSALFILLAALTIFLIVAGKIRPMWPLVRPQQVVAINSFVACMLVVMLFFGILPLSHLPQSTSAGSSPPDAENCKEGGPDVSASTLTKVYAALEPRDLTAFHSLTRNSPQTSSSNANNACNSCHYDPATRHPDVRDRQAPNTRQPDSQLVFQPSNPRQSESAQQVSQKDQVESQARNPAVMPKRELARAHLNRSGVKLGIFNVEVLVDTSGIIPLIESDSSVAAKLSLPPPKNLAKITEVVDTSGHAEGTLVANHSSGESQPSSAEVQPSNPVSLPATVGVARKTLALVVFDSPTRLAILNKGDRFNANFKPMRLSATDPRAAVLECVVTGEVQDVRQTDGTNLEIRVGLTLSWMRNGSVVTSTLDLLLTDCGQSNENSHYGVLAIPAPQTQVADVARLESRLRKP